MRKLVTIRKVDKLLPIPKADRIEIAMIGGWSCIVKKGEFSEGDEGLFFEIDSWIPGTDARFEFLGKTKDYNGVAGWRLRTMKMRGVVSQGLLLPLSSFPELDLSNEDHAETLGVLKWEQLDRTTNPQSGANGKTPKFPRFIPKTDQERIQNLMHYFELHKDMEFEETMKLDGSSMTCYKVASELGFWKNAANKIASTFNCKPYFDAVHFGVCSRNLELKASDNFTATYDNNGVTSTHSNGNFWDTALKYNLHRILPLGYAVQGELIGPSIQSNHEKVEELEFYIYDVYNINAERYLTPGERSIFCEAIPDVPHVPITSLGLLFEDVTTFDELQERVTGESINPGTISEGRVYKSLCGAVTFKAVSNEYLLKGGN